MCSLLAIEVRFQPTSLALLTEDSGTILFAKLIDGNDIYRSEKIVEANYWTFNGAFLLNASPGTYVAIGARKKYTEEGDSVQIGGITFEEDSENVLRTVVFPDELIRMSKTVVKENSFAYMGNFIFRESIPEENKITPDKVQEHYLKVLSSPPYAPGGIKTYATIEITKSVAIKMVDPGTVTSFRLLCVDSKRMNRLMDELKFISANKRYFVDTSWHDVIEERAVLLKNK